MLDRGFLTRKVSIILKSVIQKAVKSTRRDNILDIFLTNRPSILNYSDTVSGISDHEAVFDQ